MNQYTQTASVVRRVFVLASITLLFCTQTAYAANVATQSVTLEPGWNIVSTPRILESHAFSIPETLSNFAIFTLDPSRPSGWATMADLGQTQFVPLYGYFINNQSTTSQTLTFNYKASTTPNERLFERSFATSGWYAIGVANPTYADRQNEIIVDENNPSQVLDSVISASDLVIDFTDANSQSYPASVALSDPWKAVIASDVNSLADIRDTKGYGIYIKNSGAHYIGYQNESQDNSSNATADFSGFTLPTPGTADPQNNFVVWQRTLNIGSHDAGISSIRFTESGSVGVTDIKNFRLLIDGVQVGATIDQVEGNHFINFSFATQTPVKMGSHEIKVVADINGGSSRNFKFSLASVSDVAIWDTQLNTPVTPSVLGGTFSSIDGGTVSINAGTLIITKSTSSPSGNIVLNGSGVTLAKFDFKANGEKLKVENLKFNFISSDVNVTKLRNAAIFANGVQIGSTQDLMASGTQYNLGSSLVINPGSVVLIEIRGDVFDIDGINDMSTGDTLLISLMSGDSNVYRMSSYGYFSNIESSGSQLTVSGAELSLVKYSAYAAQTVTVPQTAYKIGEYRLTTGNSEGVNLDTITLGLTTSGVVTNLTDIYVVYGGKTTTSKSTGAASQTFSINETVAANATLTFAVYANMNANLTGTVVSTLAVSGTSQSSGQAVTSAVVTGQTITQGTGSITVVADASTPVTAAVVGNSMPKVGSYKFTGLNDAFTIDELTLEVQGGTNASAAIKNIVVKDGATTLATYPVNLSNQAGMTGLSIAVPFNTSKILDVYTDLGTIGTGAAMTGQNVGVRLVSYEYMNSNGVKTKVFGSTSTNPFYAFKTKPTITNVALPTSILSDGTQTLGKIQITADAGGPVAWKTIKFTVSNSGAATVTPSTWKLYNEADQSNVLATGVQASQIVTFSTDQEVTGSKTYVVKGNIQGTVVNDSISLKIASSINSYVAPTTLGAVGSGSSFVWSDKSDLNHSDFTADWMNDFFVKNLPTDSQTLSK